ncbi:hypothetical protein Emtol_0908 [Emticicia oligotrophica DSM 17448]|uniref:DinB-like domain-containing protein n=1 Tax=Emticicia oligotrophica (strain DSM 17448 / CIP 109782 / MTCC 6937 / GPTSA100-15) TaxID=929562 RepID=A0ABM5MY68_EMTOG|nr:DinB family protein [Emticicia oligotrophica]AFK02059.1 hypothetical protein Emtol_0908 [Emticicia oligotrophica DSM 17448]
MSKLEVWLRGPLPDVPPLLQPIVHTLLQAQEELHESLAHFANHLLWQRPEGVASVAFHLQHITGVLDRLLTYARGEMLNEQQLDQLKAEGVENQSITVQGLLDALDIQVEKAINQIKKTNQESLTEIRYVGRARIPSTQIGLLFHAAEHTTRHLGQLLVTAKSVK